MDQFEKALSEFWVLNEVVSNDHQSWLTEASQNGA